MSRIECQREAEILDAVASDRWPDRAGDELSTHVSTCSICSELAMVATIYRDDYSAALEATHVPSAGLVWWKSELRARREAVRVAARPITAVQGIAGACVIGVLLALLRHVDIAAVSAFMLEQPLVLWLVMGVIIALTPIALYFVYSGE